VRTGRTGAAAKAGHDLLIHVTAWQATLEVSEDPAHTRIALDVDPTSLRVREGSGGVQDLGGDDKASIESTIGDEVLKGHAIEFRSTVVQAATGGSRLSVRGELTLVGETRPLAFDLVVGDGTLTSRVVIKQSNWGITPYSTLFGALKVADEVEVELDAGLQPRAQAGIPTYERIRPRELKPALLELTWISRASIQAHYKLYQGYVNKRNEILGILDADPDQLRALKVDLSFAVGGIKNHEIYFEHLGGDGGEPHGAFASLIVHDFGSTDAWRTDLKATGMAGRGWAWTAYDWDAGRVFNYIGDAQSSFPIWNATPLVALDVYEHAYFLDFQTDRGAYIDAFFDNLDWAVVNDWVSKYEIPFS
jgi:Fe-Mn family superoxide dismutase